MANPQQEVDPPDWRGPDDPDCPYNWPLWKRIYSTSIPAFLCVNVSFASSVYTSGANDVSEKFGVSHTASLLGLSLFLWALGLGAIIAAPVSEYYGRRIVYLSTVPVFGLFILGSGLAQNFTTLIVCRFFAGFFGSAVVSVGGGTNADLWPPALAGFVYPFYFVSPFLGPAFGPVIGGFLAEEKDFRWLEWVVLFMVAFNYIYALPQFETYKKTILQRRIRAEKQSDAPQAHTPKVALPSSAIIQRIVLKPFKMLFVESIVLFMTIYMAFNFAVFYSFFAAFPYVFGGHYGFTPGQQGLTFISIALGCVIGFLAVVYIDRKTYPALEAKYGVGAVPPEYRLYGAMVGCALNPASLFWFGWTADKGVYWLSPVIASVPFAVGNIMVYSSGALYIMNSYGSLHGASALSANSLLRYAGGGAFPLFTVQMFSSMGIGWASSLLGFVSVVLVPVPWVLYKYGSRIRAHSQYITIKEPVSGNQTSFEEMTSEDTES
ncbi:major facilitator superfamily domain-containing protein [Colletotrichum phormii]|uniref:Major facilitator superfamily domain-containing protein n=1 Tax=Colletotrichum phormii TaxID=359342 RepID=A0AAI9ZLT5_9PEZI|nr:major facilitator superfamily domain-containing protein [Colletotrichum phormii]KAK1634026.1 major facilitator superfamily domain-containing protein [Colletotrichum phormii]